MAEAEFIHVKDKSTGHEYPVRAHLFNPDAHEETGKPALGRDGFPVPPKFKTTVAKAAAKGSRYDGWTVPQLKDEVDKRLDARGPEDRPIEVEPPANKPQLIAALTADDEAAANTEKENS